MYVRLESHQLSDNQYLTDLKKALVENLNYSEEQANQTINFAKKKGKCKVFEGSVLDLQSITLKFAEKNLSVYVENKSLK